MFNFFSRRTPIFILDSVFYSAASSVFTLPMTSPVPNFQRLFGTYSCWWDILETKYLCKFNLEHELVWRIVTTILLCLWYWRSTARYPIQTKVGNSKEQLNMTPLALHPGVSFPLGWKFCPSCLLRDKIFVWLASKHALVSSGNYGNLSHI